MSQLRRTLWVIFTLGAIATLLGMSFWQLQRLQWKEAKIAAYEKAAMETALPIATFEPLSEAAQYRHASITGIWQAGKELHLGGRRWHTQTGYQILTPLKTEDGKTYLINRGWVPTKLKDASTRPEQLPAEPVTVEGMIRLPEAPGMFTPANHPEKNFWFTVDITAMSKALDETLEPMTLEIIHANPPADIYPIPADGKVVLRNDHLGYAVTWFLLAIAAGVIGYLRLRGQRSAVESVKTIQ